MIGDIMTLIIGLALLPLIFSSSFGVSFCSFRY